MFWILLATLSFAETGLEDTASLGDTAEDTAEDTSEDTSTEDSSTNNTTTDSSTTTDSGDTGYTVVSASSLAGEKGGFGCASVGVGGVLALWLSTFVIGLRRREDIRE